MFEKCLVSLAPLLSALCLLHLNLLLQLRCRFAVCCGRLRFFMPFLLRLFDAYPDVGAKKATQFQTKHDLGVICSGAEPRSLHIPHLRLFIP